MSSVPRSGAGFSEAQIRTVAEQQIARGQEIVDSIVNGPPTVPDPKLDGVRKAQEQRGAAIVDQIVKDFYGGKSPGRSTEPPPLPSPSRRRR